MPRILIVTGSARPNSTNATVVEQVKARLAAREGVEAQVANLAEIGLPFFDSPQVPSSPNYVITDSRGQQWSEMVKAADGVVFAMPEYNYNMTAIQKNALDWLSAEWKEKPAAQVAYGWSGGSRALQSFAASNEFLKMDLAEPAAQLRFTETLNPDGSVLDQEGVTARIDATLDALLAKLA